MRGDGKAAFSKALSERAAKSVQFDGMKAQIEHQKKRLGRHVDFLNETGQLDAFVKWDQVQGEEPE